MDCHRKGIMVYNHQTHECIAAQPYTKEFKNNRYM